jgi:excisionase family DNA binding protein
VIDTYALLNIWYPGSFPSEARFKLEKAEFPSGLWSTEIAAEYIGVHPDTLRKWVRLGKFPRIPLPGSGKDFRFSREMIDEWARKRALNDAN